MPRSRSLRPRPSTPNLRLTGKLHRTHTAADPTSPPETPTASPPLSRKISLKPRHQPEFFVVPPLAADPNIKPVGNGHQFSYQPTLAPEQLSPRSSSSSSDADDDDDQDDDDDDSEDDESSDADSMLSSSAATMRNAPSLAMSDVGGNESAMETSESESTDDSGKSNGDSDESDASDDGGIPTMVDATVSTMACDFTIEDIDSMSDCEGLEVIRPTEIESNRSRSCSRHRGVDKDMIKDLKNLNCSNETSENDVSPGETDPEEMFYRQKERLKKLRRMSMGSSFGKRTHSEMSDSDDGGEALDVNDVGSSARRLRRKLHRTSLLFQDPPQERIEELEEPDSGDEVTIEHPFLRELPYWAMEIMEVDSA